MPMVMLRARLRSIDINIVDDIVNGESGRRVSPVGVNVIECHLGQLGEVAIECCKNHVGGEDAAASLVASEVEGLRCDEIDTRVALDRDVAVFRRVDFAIGAVVVSGFISRAGVISPELGTYTAVQPK